jgi:2-polyprenyl-3-methyl-5-hydroxy-6-metoxy-1,4-benzoquinol methylase
MKPSAPPCLACGAVRSEPWTVAHDVEYRTSNDEFEYRHCQSCDALFIDPVPEHRLREIYPENYYSYQAPKGSGVASVKAWLDRRFFRSVLRSASQPTLSVLDIGGGAGLQLSTLRDSEPRVVRTQIVDLDPGARELALKNGHEYFCGRVEDFRATEPFDVILLLNLIEHVREPRQVLTRARELLAPDGLMVIKTPNWQSLDARLFQNASWAGLHCPRHWVLFTQAGFGQLVEGIGLSVLRGSYTQGAPFWAASSLAWLSRSNVVRISRERPVFDHPLYAPLAAGFAALDFLRLPFAKTSQMFFVLGHARTPG